MVSPADSRRVLKYSSSLLAKLKSMSPDLREAASEEIFRLFSMYEMNDTAGAEPCQWLSLYTGSRFEISFSVGITTFLIFDIEFRNNDSGPSERVAHGIFIRCSEGRLDQYILDENAPLQFAHELAMLVTGHAGSGKTKRFDVASIGIAIMTEFIVIEAIISATTNIILHGSGFYILEGGHRVSGLPRLLGGERAAVTSGVGWLVYLAGGDELFDGTHFAWKKTVLRHHVTTDPAAALNIRKEFGFDLARAVVRLDAQVRFAIGIVLKTQPEGAVAVCGAAAVANDLFGFSSGRFAKEGDIDALDAALLFAVEALMEPLWDGSAVGTGSMARRSVTEGRSFDARPHHSTGRAALDLSNEGHGLRHDDIGVRAVLSSDVIGDAPVFNKE